MKCRKIGTILATIVVLFYKFYPPLEKQFISLENASRQCLLDQEKKLNTVELKNRKI